MQPQGTHRAAEAEEPPAGGRPHDLHRDRVLQGAELRALPRAPGDERSARHRPPRYLAAEHPAVQERRDQARGLRAREGEHADRVDRPGRREGQVQLPLARGGEWARGRPPRRRVRGRHHPVGDVHRSPAVLRRDRLPDRRAGAPGAHPVDRGAQPRDRARARSRRSQGARTRCQRSLSERGRPR